MSNKRSTSSAKANAGNHRHSSKQSAGSQQPYENGQSWPLSQKELLALGVVPYHRLQLDGGRPAPAPDGSFTLITAEPCGATSIHLLDESDVLQELMVIVPGPLSEEEALILLTFARWRQRLGDPTYAQVELDDVPSWVVSSDPKPDCPVAGSDRLGHWQYIHHERALDGSQMVSVIDRWGDETRLVVDEDGLRAPHLTSSASQAERVAFFEGRLAAGDPLAVAAAVMAAVNEQGRS